MYRMAGSITLSSYFSNTQPGINPWSCGGAIERAARPQKAPLSVRPGTWRAANVASCGADGKPIDGHRSPRRANRVWSAQHRCAAKEVATYKAAVKAKHKKGLRILNGESPWI